MHAAMFCFFSQDAGLNVKLHDASRDIGLLSLQGPRSNDLIKFNKQSRACALELTEAVPRSRDILSRLTSAPLDNTSFPVGSHQLIQVAGHPVRALRVSFVGT